MSLNKPTITHIITGLAPGGAETFLLRLIENLKDFSHHVISLAPIDDEQFADLFRQKAKSVTSLNMSPKNIFSLYKIIPLTKLLKQQAPILVQTWMYHANFIGGIAAKISKIPVIWNIRNSSLSGENPEKLKLNSVTNWIVKIGALLSNYIPNTIISCSHYAALLHQKWGYKTDKFVIIPNGINIDVFSPQPQLKSKLRKDWNIKDEETVIGFVGRLNPQKDIPNFFEAIELFIKNKPNTQFVFCGKGLTADNPLINKWLEDKNIKANCHFLGKIRDIAPIYNGFDICSSSSAYGEAFPNVIAESMSCGIPCVATDVGDAKLIIDDIGIVVPIKNPRALAAAWESLLIKNISPDTIRQRIIDEFSITKSSESYKQLYLNKI